MGNCLSSPEAKKQVTNLETQAKAKGTEALDSLKTKLQGTGTGGQATAAQPTAAHTEGAAATTGAIGNAPPAGGVEGKLEQAVKAEEPKLAEEAKTGLTGVGGAGTAATPAANTAAI